jgi:hypothetical protein
VAWAMVRHLAVFDSATPAQRQSWVLARECSAVTCLERRSFDETGLVELRDHVMLSKYTGRRTNIALAPALHERVDPWVKGWKASRSRLSDWRAFVPR